MLEIRPGRKNLLIKSTVKIGLYSQNEQSERSELRLSKRGNFPQRSKYPISTNYRLKSFPYGFSNRTLEIDCSANDPLFVTHLKAINKLLRAKRKISKEMKETCRVGLKSDTSFLRIFG